MGNKYDALKALGVVTTAFSFYRVAAESIPIEDVIIILTASLLFIAVAGEFEKARQKADRAAERGENKLATELRKQVGALEKSVEEELGKGIAAT